MNSDAVCVTALLYHIHTIADMELLHCWPESLNNTSALVAKTIFVVGNYIYSHGNVLEVDFNLNMVLNCRLCYFRLTPGPVLECS